MKNYQSKKWPQGSKSHLPVGQCQQGQISIFFATIMLLIITLIAFIINVGLFVKAKINLQNAVDAAAWSGAAVQARQLTDIGYLNWEMFNNYKEWMFKYYGLGSLNLPGVADSPTSGNPVNYRMNSIVATNQDEYNFPSICINPQDGEQGGSNICRQYVIPGLPRIQQVNLLALDESTSQFIDQIAEAKAKNCAIRTRLNYLAAWNWAYGTGSVADLGVSDMPAIASDGMPGAWTANLEIAMRIRNLEFVANKQPLTEGICADQGSAAASCGRNISALENSGDPGFERPYKAFYSAYRNLGNSRDSEMKSSFVLTELSPKEVSFLQAGDLSTYLTANKVTSKYYLDLKIMPVNFVSFYNFFFANTEGGDADAACVVQKTGLPVPAFPFGFVKNPEVMTYYAVKGEANFMGLFNPFADYIKLTAFAAAKPFGGRVGPALFDVFSNPTLVKVRSSGNRYRSTPLVSGVSVTPNQQASGENPFPVLPPTSQAYNFWVVDQDQAVGGNPVQGSDAIRFAIPNMPYGADNADNNTLYGVDRLTIIQNQNDPALDKGLYNGDFFETMFSRFRNNPQDLLGAIRQVRAPSLWEARNYMIPMPQDLHRNFNLDSFGVAVPERGDGVYDLRINAPLFGQNQLFTEIGEVQNEVEKYTVDLRASVETYLTAIQNAARTMNTIQSAGGTSTEAGEIYQQARQALSSVTGVDPSTEYEIEANCQSQVGLFAYFFLGGNGAVQTIDGNCPVPLPDVIVNYFSNTEQINTNQYVSRVGLVVPEESSSEQLKSLFSAYRPGRAQGGDVNSGDVLNPFRGIASNALRNFYSTKFITLGSVSSTGPGTHTFASQTNSAPLYSEGVSDAGFVPTTISNPIQGQEFADYLMNTDL